MALIGLTLAIVAGWLDWSHWLAIPIGFLVFLGMRQYYPERTSRVGAILPMLIAWGIIAVASALFH